MLNSKWNLPENYEVGNREKVLRNKLPEVPAFRYMENEKLVVKSQPYFSFEGKDMSYWIGELEEEIVARVAMSKYLTLTQLFEFLCMAGECERKDKVERRVKKLVKCHVLRECNLVIPELLEEDQSLHCYRLDHWGFHLARDMGVMFHKGIAYHSPRVILERGLEEDNAMDVKRILTGNQILLGLLKSQVVMKRFGVMETFRPVCDDTECYEGEKNTLVRSTVNVQIDDGSILAFDVVRDYEDAYEKIADKVRRYYNLDACRQYMELNYHNYKEVPQLILCGESFEHNCKIRDYLKSEGLWDGRVTILFTEDLLNIQDSSRSIYGFAEDGSIVWYELPTKLNVNANVA